MNKPDILNGDLWIYAIHSNKAEMIHALEENKILPKDLTYEKCVVESIKCHHNKIANYIRDSLFDKSKDNKNKVAFGISRRSFITISNSCQMILKAFLNSSFI